MADFYANTAHIKNIQNPNNLNITNFRLVFRNLRLENDLLDFQLNCQISDLPGVSQIPQEIQTPFNRFNVQGAKLQYEDLNITFKVDEDLNNWIQLYSWLVGITAPQTYEQFVDYQGLPKPRAYEVTVDASMFSLTNAMNPNVEIVYRNIMPVSISAVRFDISSQTDDVLHADASFRYDYYDFKRTST